MVTIEADTVVTATFNATPPLPLSVKSFMTPKCKKGKVKRKGKCVKKRRKQKRRQKNKKKR